MSDSKHELNLEEIGKEEEAYGQFEALDTREALKHRGKRGYRILRHVDTARTSDDERLLQTILTDIHQIRNELDHLRTENSEEETFNDKPEKSPLADTPQNKLFSLNIESEVLTVDGSAQDAQSEETKEEIDLNNNIEEVHIEPVDSIELQMTEANMQKMGMLDSDELKEFNLDSLAMPHHERFNDVDIDIPVDNYPADLEAEASVTASLSKIAHEDKLSSNKEKTEEEQANIPASEDEQESIGIAVPLETLAQKNEPSQEISVQEESISEAVVSEEESEIDPLDAVLPPPDIQPSAQQQEEDTPGEEELSAEESVMASLMKAAENAAVTQLQETNVVTEEAAVEEDKSKSEEDILSEFDFSDLEGPAPKSNGAAVGDSSADILGEENLSQIILENDSIVSTELTSLPSSEKLVELLQRPIESTSSDDLNVVIPVGPMFDGDLSSITPAAGQNAPVHGEEESYAVVQEAEALDETTLEAVAEAEIESVDEIVESAEPQPEIVEPEEEEEIVEAEEDSEEEEPVLEADFVEAEETDAVEEEIEEEEEPEYEESVSSEGNFAELEEEIIEEAAEEVAEEPLSEQQEDEEETQPNEELQETEVIVEEAVSEREEGDLDVQETEAALEEIEESELPQMADENIPEAEDPEVVNEIADEVLSKDVLDALEKASQMHAAPSSALSSGATQFSYDQDLFNDLEGFIGFFENIFAKIPQDEQMRLAETLGYAAYLRVKGKVEKESLRQVTSSMLDSLTLDDLEEGSQDNKEDSSPLARYREDAMQRGRIPFVLEMNRETLTAQIVVLSEDEVDMAEAEAQWVSFLKDFLHSEGFVISSEMHTIVISSRPLEMSENDYLESLINDASDVFGVQPDESLFEPFFIPLDNQMVKKLSAQIQ